jgi:hypothetical protein
MTKKSLCPTGQIQTVLQDTGQLLTQSDRTPSVTSFHHLERVNIGLVRRSHPL